MSDAKIWLRSDIIAAITAAWHTASATAQAIGADPDTARVFAAGMYVGLADMAIRFEIAPRDVLPEPEQRR